MKDDKGRDLTWMQMDSKPNEMGEVQNVFTLTGYWREHLTVNGKTIETKGPHYEYNLYRGKPIPIPTELLPILDRVPFSEMFANRSPRKDISFKKVEDPKEEEWKQTISTTRIAALSPEEVIATNAKQEIAFEKKKSVYNAPNFDASRKVVAALEDNKEATKQARDKEVVLEKKISGKKKIKRRDW